METILLVIFIAVVSLVYQLSKNFNGRVKARPFSMNRPEFQEAYKNPKAGTKRSTANISLESRSQAIIEKQMDKEVPKKISMEPHTSRREENEQIHADTATYSNQIVEQKTWVNAVIWSEILGEPRSKKPYSIRRF